MKDKTKNIISVSIIGFLWLVISIVSWLSPSQDISLSERRKLTQKPKLEVQNILSGNFMIEFEKYSQDQFPNRFLFRSLKSYTRFYIFNQSDNNDIYISENHASKLDYKLKEKSVINAANKFRYIYNRYLKDSDVNIYLSIIPDKGYYLAEKNEYPSMDYKRMFQLIKDETDFAKYIDILDVLTLDDYYKTDTHWRQEKIIKVAEEIAKAMGVQKYLSGEYSLVEHELPFYGVYYGQSALPIGHDKLNYLTNETIDGCVVYNMETDKTTSVYDTEKLYGFDPYDVFLSGATPLLTIDNPNSKTDKELLIFRDSFASSLTPLLLEGYAKVTLVDIRYMTSDSIENFIHFDKQDVLFIYGTQIINSSYVLK